MKAFKIEWSQNVSCALNTVALTALYSGFLFVGSQMIMTIA